MAGNLDSIIFQIASIAPAMNNLMHALDGKSEGSADELQTFAFGVTLTDEVVTLVFRNMFFSDGILREGNAPIEAVKQPIHGEIQSG